jgi:hypothetical protein
VPLERRPLQIRIPQRVPLKQAALNRGEILAVIQATIGLQAKVKANQVPQAIE